MGARYFFKTNRPTLRANLSGGSGGLGEDLGLADAALEILAEAKELVFAECLVGAQASPVLELLEHAEERRPVGVTNRELHVSDDVVALVDRPGRPLTVLATSLIALVEGVLLPERAADGAVGRAEDAHLELLHLHDPPELHPVVGEAVHELLHQSGVGVVPGIGIDTSGVLVLEVVDAVVDPRIREGHGVADGEDDDLAGGLLAADVHAAGVGEVVDHDDLGSGSLSNDAGAVGGVIVHHDQLNVMSGLLLGQLLDQAVQLALFVQRTDDNGNLHGSSSQCSFVCVNNSMF